jgi:raffinose/stachyose/melibiose transport system substrate-binding protein
MKARMYGVSLASAASLLLTVCSAGGSAAPSRYAPNDQITGTITVLTNRTDMQANGMLAQYAKAFEQKYPGTKVVWQTFVDFDPVKAQMNGGKYPDVMLVNTSVVALNEFPQFFAPLDDLGLDNQIYFKSYGEVGGNLYAIASFGDADGLVYNKAAFKKAGITSFPRTLSQFYADCAKLKQAGIIPIELNYTDKWPLGVWSGALPDLIAKNPNYNNTLVNTNTPFSPSTPMGEALGIVRHIVDEGWAEPDWKNTNWARSKVWAAQGKAAMMFLGNWAIPQYAASGTTTSNVGFMPFPASNNGKNAIALGPDWLYAVNKNSSQLATAKAFVKWELEGSGFTDYADGIPTIKMQKSSIPQLAGFEQAAAQIMVGLPDSAAYNKVTNGAQLDVDGGGMVQTVLTASNFNAELQQLNQQWASARSMIGG